MDNWDPFGDSNNQTVPGNSDSSELAWPTLEPASSNNQDNPLDLFNSNINVTESASLYPALSSEETVTAAAAADVDNVDTQDKNVMSNDVEDDTKGSSIKSESPSSAPNDSNNQTGKKVELIL